MNYWDIFVKQKKVYKLGQLSLKRCYKDKPVTSLQALALSYIIKNSENREVFAKDLKDFLMITGSSVASLINNLEKSGYIIRKVHKNDARCILIEPTEKAKETLKDTDEIGYNFVRNLYKGISENDLNIFSNVMEKILDNIDH